MLQRIQLSIDPYFNNHLPDDYDTTSSTSGSSSSSSFSLSPQSNASPATTQSPISPESGWRLFYVLCLYEFTSEDPDHLPFPKGEILEIVKQEESGWWAALRDNRVGWIPRAFVTRIADEHVGKLRQTRQDLRVCQYEVELNYEFAPVTAISRSKTLPLSLSAAKYKTRAAQDVEWPPFIDSGNKVTLPLDHYSPSRPPHDFPDDIVTPLGGSISQSPPRQANVQEVYETDDIGTETNSEPGQECTVSTQCYAYPPSPATPMPHPLMPKIEPLHITRRAPTSNQSQSLFRSPLLRSRSDSGSIPLTTTRKERRQPMMRNDRLSISSVSISINSNDSDAYASTSYHYDMSHEFSDEEIPSPRSRRVDKVKQLLGDGDAQAFHNAKQAQAKLPWFLQPSYTRDDIKLEYDGSVRAGTLSALTERLTVDPLKLTQDNLYRHAFLTTLHTFTTPTELFDHLVGRYQIEPPPDLTDDEIKQWRAMKLRPVQKRVLTVLTYWLEEHDMLDNGPEFADRLRDFLGSIQSPPTQALSARLIVQSLERIMTQAAAAKSPSPQVTPTKRRKISKLGSSRGDLCRIDPMELAQQLTLFERRLYAKVKASECITWRKTQTGESVKNLLEFCSTHDKLAAWVKSSVLINEGLSKRADTVDFWIKVAEKCRLLNNFSSTTSIVAALSSAVITRLYLTLAHVGRGASLYALSQLILPTGNFAAYRNLHRSVDGPSIPFIGVFLSDIVHVQDQMRDNVSFQVSANSSPTTATLANTPTNLNMSSSSLADGPMLINFVKRQKLYDAVDAILRFRNKIYSFSEDPSILSYIVEQLSINSARDDTVFWARSQEIQQSEKAHADIRKGLEAAGF